MARYPTFDWMLFLLGLALSVSGLVYIYSATWVAQEPPGYYLSSAAKDQALFLIASILVFYFLRRVNWALKPVTWLWFYVPILILLIVVLLIGIGGDSHGATRWISFGKHISFQPSELAKAGFIMILAWFFSAEQPRLTQRFIQAAGVMCSLIVFVLLQPDLGTSLVFVFCFFIVASLTPIARRTVLIALACLVLLSVPAWLVMRDYQRNRVLVFTGWEIVPPEEGGGLRKADPLGSAYQIKQSMIAVGSGGWTGKGFLRGTQSRGGFVPEQESDSIFALVGEEFGFFGCMYLMTLYLLLLLRLLSIAQYAKTDYERYICYGISSIIFFHVFVSMGMSIGLMPLTGLPLPFISKGGSALLTMWALLAVAQSIFSNSRRELKR